MRFGTNYVIGAPRKRWSPRKVIADRRLRGWRLDGNPIGRICLARFIAPGGDGRVMACDPRVLGVVAPQRPHSPSILVLFGPLDHRSEETQVRSSSGARSVYAPRSSFRKLAIRESGFPRGVLKTRGRPGSRRRGSTCFSGAVCTPPWILGLSRRRSSN